MFAYVVDVDRVLRKSAVDLLLSNLLYFLDDLLFLDLVGVLLGQRFRSFNWLAEQESSAGGCFLQFVEDRCDQTVTLATHGTDLKAIEVVQVNALLKRRKL